MDRKQKGFTLIEILVVVTIIGVLAGLVVVLIPQGKEKADQLQCTNNVRQLCQSLIAVSGSSLPDQGGVNLLLYLYKGGTIERDEQNLGLLFCPGDKIESLREAGGVDVYKNLDLEKQGEHGNLSSYAGRNQRDRKCVANLSSTKTQALMCDDSQDHHLGKGFVVGYTNGAAKFREKLEHWKLDVAVDVKVGTGSEIEELKCLNTDD